MFKRCIRWILPLMVLLLIAAYLLLSPLQPSHAAAPSTPVPHIVAPQIVAPHVPIPDVLWRV